MPDFDKAIQVLEFDRVLEIIATGAVSEPGKERVKRLKPMTDSEMIQMELNRVRDMLNLIEKGDNIPFKGIHDLTQQLKIAAVKGAALSPESLNKIANTVACARLVKKFLQDRAKDAALLAQMANRMNTFEELEKAVHNAIDEVNEVRDTASPKLKHIRSTIASEKSKARASLARLLKDWNERGYLQDEIIASREGRLTLPVKGNARGKVKGLLVDQSSTGSTFYIEPLETVEINNNIRRLQLEEKKEIDHILREITAIVHKYRLEIEETVGILAELDSILARALYAGRFNCSQPQINTNNRLKIVAGRHPLLLIKEKIVVPLELELPDDVNTLVVSGPNAGGKTVALKTVGILTLMVMAGCWIPAAKGTCLPLVKEIYAIVGDDQSIAADLSTFSAHLQKLTNVMASAEKKKMALIDEIMSGTDPAEGTALAIAVLEKLTKDGAITLCTTHKGDLKAFAHKTDGVINGSLEFDPTSLSPTYRFLVGIPGSSYAFSLAKKVGFPEDIIHQAENLRGRDRGALESLLLELNEKMTEVERMKISAAAHEAKVKSMQKQLQEQLKNVRTTEKKLIEKAEKEAEKVLANANRVIENAVKEIREKKASPEAVKSAHMMLEKNKTMFYKRRKYRGKQKQLKREPIHPGDRVKLMETDITGEIIDGKNSKGKFLVEAGSFKIWVDEESLIKISPPKKTHKKPDKTKISYRLPEDTLSPTLDIRGLDSKQAAVKLEEYIIKAVSADFQQVEIIHGKGAGILRKVVNDLLADNPEVESCKPGEFGAGDYGVTVVKLK